MHRTGFAIVLGVLALLPLPAGAEACYTLKEVEAEQGMRIHSELLVIGLTCAHAPEYEAFSTRNADLIAYYETSLMEYYAQEGEENPEAQLHALRTSLANQVAEHAVEMSVQSFCDRFEARAAQAAEMDQQSLREWASYIWEENMLSRPVCEGSRV